MLTNLKGGGEIELMYVGEQRPRRAAAQKAAQRIAEQLQEEEN